MLASFDQLVAQARALGTRAICVAVAQDRDVLLAAKGAAELGLARSILIGDERAIRAICGELDLDEGVTIVHEPDNSAAALLAAETVREGKADVLVKGRLNSSDFLKAVLDPSKGLRSGKILSHIAAFQIPSSRKLVFHSDGGMNIAPTLDEKEQILRNAIDVVRRLGIEVPKIAILAANEKPSPKMPATMDAQVLAERWKTGTFPPCVIEGPIAMDVAASGVAAERKGIPSAIAGDVDLFIVPNIEAGNMIGKTLVYYAGAQIAGIVAGASKPIVMVSRSDSAKAKIDSIAFACLLAARSGR
jgi:phosphate butyryltransferase